MYIETGGISEKNFKLILHQN